MREDGAQISPVSTAPTHDLARVIEHTNPGLRVCQSSHIQFLSGSRILPQNPLNCAADTPAVSADSFPFHCCWQSLLEIRALQLVCDREAEAAA